MLSTLIFQLQWLLSYTDVYVINLLRQICLFIVDWISVRHFQPEYIVIYCAELDLPILVELVRYSVFYQVYVKDMNRSTLK